MLKQHDIAERTVLGDAGRVAAGFPNEKRDCTVRATAEAFQVDYATAHAACKKAGRKDGGGLCYAPAITVGFFSHLGKATVLKSLSQRRLSTVLPLLSSQDNYIVRVKKHVFAVRGGKIQDANLNLPGKIVRNVWRIQPDANRPGRVARIEWKPILQREVSTVKADSIRWQAVWNGKI